MLKGKLILVMVLAVVWVNAFAGEKKQEPQKAYHVEEVGKNTVKLIPDLHLVPPASQLVHKGIDLEEMAKLPEGEELKKKAQVDIDFFKGLYEKDLGGEKELVLKKAVFDVYRDFHGLYTDPVYFIIELRGKKPSPKK